MTLDILELPHNFWISTPFFLIVVLHLAKAILQVVGIVDSVRRLVHDVILHVFQLFEEFRVSSSICCVLLTKFS